MPTVRLVDLGGHSRLVDITSHVPVVVVPIMKRDGLTQVVFEACQELDEAGHPIYRQRKLWNG